MWWIWGAYLAKVICKLYDVPFISFKYITDDADGDAGSDWQENVEKGIEVFKQKVLEELN